METREIKTKLDGDGDDDDDVDPLHLQVVFPFVVKSSLQNAEIWSDTTKRNKSPSCKPAKARDIRVQMICWLGKMIARVDSI